MLKLTLQQLANKVREHANAKQALKLSDLGLNDQTVIPLIAVINANPNIQILDLSFNLIGNRGAKALADLKHVKHLNLRANQVSNQGIEAFYNNLQLTHLILDLNMNIEDSSALGLAKQSRLLDLKLLACSVSANTRGLIANILKERLRGESATNDPNLVQQRRTLFLEELN